MTARLEHGVPRRAGGALVPTVARWAAMSATDLDIAPTDFRLAGRYTRIADLAPDGPVICIDAISGQCISRRDWWQPVREGDVLVFKDVRLHGGDNSDVLRTVLTIVVLVVAASYGVPVGEAFGLTGAQAGAVGSALITVGGNLLVNAILPSPGQAGGFTSQAATSPTYSIGGSGNAARLGQSIPVRYGQEFVYPDFASQPYAEYDANSDQYYCAVLSHGYGHFNILQVTIEDTDIRSFADVQVALVGPGQSLRSTVFPGYETLLQQNLVLDNMVVAPEVSQTDLGSTDWIGGFICVASGREMNRVYFDVVYPEGIGSIQPDGHVDEYSVTLQHSVRRVNDDGQPIGVWQLLGTVHEAAATRQPVRRSYAYDLPAGRYQARQRRLLDIAESAYILDSAVWVGLRARLTVRGVLRDDCTYVVVRMRANEQLSGLSQRRIGVHGQRLIPVYDVDTQTWSAPVFTRYAAHAFADILHDDVEGRGLPDNRIDLITLADIAGVNAARQDHFDFSFDTRRTVDEALTLVARSCRARPILRRGAIYTLVRDEQQAAPVAMFMPRNMQKDSFSMTFGLKTEETPDCIRMEFRNGRTWTTDYVYAQIHAGGVVAYGNGNDGQPLLPAGVPAPQRVQEERIAGVVGRMHALREAVFMVADPLYRPISCQWKTELDALLPTIGSLVGTAHDVAAWGQSGDVVEWIAGSLTLATSEPLRWAAGITHYVRLQTNVGGASAAIVVTPGHDDHSMVLATAPDEVPVFASADRERTRYLFGSIDDVTRYGRVKRLAFESDTDATIAAVLEDNRAHTADNALLPALGEIQDPLSTGAFSGGDTGAGGADGGPGIPVTLADSRSYNRLFFATDFTGFELGLSFNNDASILNAFPGGLSGPTGPGYTQWLQLYPVSPAVAAQYEIRFEYLGTTFGSMSIDSPALNTWMGLGTSRNVLLSGSIATGPTGPAHLPGNIGLTDNSDRAEGRLRIRIRETVSQIEQAVCVYTLRVVFSVDD